MPARTAVIAIDVQNDFFAEDGVFAKAGRDMSLARERLPAMVKLMARAQEIGLMTVFLRQVTLPGGVADSPAWLRLKVRDGKSPDYTLTGSWGGAFCDGMTPRKTDPIIEKLRPDAFHRTHLDLILRANGIDTCVFLGANTEGCVESTVRSSAHHDYYTVVAEDAVASSNAAFHDASLALMRNRFLVASSDEILSCLTKAAT
ncbi:isochorismatase family cysteine hydrolase [Pararhodobacter sp. SW119]|uniref:cysteine hydrolase family protein n=1 Tax=Pararhodobacter sp. SW119 TaxID=2780075 RepID=UPI001ADFD276